MCLGSGKSHVSDEVLWQDISRSGTRTFSWCCTTHIRPHVEYCIQAWPPYRVKDIQCLENIQRRATKYVAGMERAAYERRLKQLKLNALEQRRKRGDMIEVHRLMTGKENIEYQKFVEKARSVHNLWGHTLKLYKERSRLDLRKHFFSNRVVQDWDALPQSPVGDRCYVS